jgi:hypothetical protein
MKNQSTVNISGSAVSVKGDLGCTPSQLLVKIAVIYDVPLVHAGRHRDQVLDDRKDGLRG